MGLVYMAGNNSNLEDIPPNLTNAACIATAGLLTEPSKSGTTVDGVNATYPVPFESSQTSDDIERWCPWDLQVSPPKKPGDGVYPYPDDNIQRPAFNPCLSACAKTNSPSDCCTGDHDSPSKCKAGLYSKQAKAVCPDAYSFAYDDQTSTFIIPTGGGWEVTFCPKGRSTNILNTFAKELSALGSSGMSKALNAVAMNLTVINAGGKESAAAGRAVGEMGDGVSLGALVVVVAWAVLW
jgi:hypothetical protein